MKFEIALFILLIAIPVVLAENVNVDISFDKDSFSVGDYLEFSYNITSDNNAKLVYSPAIICDDIPAPLLETRELDVRAKRSLEGSFKSALIEEQSVPQRCTASISVYSPIKTTSSKDFLISTIPAPKFNLKAGVDNAESKVFVKNSKVELNYETDLLVPRITAFLSYPSGKKQEITLPASVRADEIGNYNLEVSVSGEGYRTVEKTMEFGVIERQVYVKSDSVCKVDGVCSINEDPQNCPQDCTSKFKISINKETFTNFFGRIRGFFSGN